MKVLALSTSARIATAAIVVDGVCTLELAAPDDKRHAETALPLVEQVLLQTDLPLEAIDFFAVDVGPGSFTGVRIGVSILNAVARAQGKPIVGVDALRAIDQARVLDGGRACVLLDAGNGNGYAAEFCNHRVVSGPDAVEIASYRAKLPQDVQLVTDIADASVMPRAGAVGEAACVLFNGLAERLAAKPLYLRPSQAERMWKMRSEAAAK